MPDQPDKLKLQDSINENVLADSLADIAGYTVEKHEFLDNSQLSPDQSKEAEEFVLQALWRSINERRKRRLTILEECFQMADDILQKVVGTA